MYPPKKDSFQQKPKLSYFPTRQSPSPKNSTKDLHSINRILENAKNYQKEKEVKKDYMMDGLVNFNRQISPKSGLPKKNSEIRPSISPPNESSNNNIKSQAQRQSEQSSRNKQSKISQNNIYTTVINEDKQPQIAAKSKQKNSKYSNQIQRLKSQMIKDRQQQQEQVKYNNPIQINISQNKNSPQNEVRSQNNNSLSDKSKTNEKQLNSLIETNRSVQRNLAETRSIPRESARKQNLKSNERSYIDPIMLANRENQNTIVSLKSKVEETQQQLVQMRNKYLKSEQKRLLYEQRIEKLQKEGEYHKKCYDKSRINEANLEGKLVEKESYIKSLLERIEAIESKKNDKSAEIQQKMHYSNQQLIDKVNQIRYLGSKVTNYEKKVKDKQYEIIRLNEILDKKQNAISVIRGQYEHHTKQLQKQVAQLIQEKHKQSKNPELIAQNLKLKEEAALLKKNQTKIRQLQGRQQQRQRIVQKLQSQIREKDVLIGHLKNKSNASMDDLRIQTLEQQLTNSQNQIRTIVDNYEQQILNQDRTIHQLTEELQQSQRKRLEGNFMAKQLQLQEFQTMIKKQSQQMNEIRQKNTQKTFENLQLMGQLQRMKSQIKNLQNSNKVIVTQLNHAQKNNNDSHVTNSKIAENEISALKRKLESLNQQMQSRKKEMTNKDNFIQNYILGLNKQENTSELVMQLEKILQK